MARSGLDELAKQVQISAGPEEGPNHQYGWTLHMSNPLPDDTLPRIKELLAQERGTDYFYLHTTCALLLSRLEAAEARAAAGEADTIEKCALIAASHKGSYAKRGNYKAIMRTASEEARFEIRAEERGEDIASEIIARNIRAREQTMTEYEMQACAQAVQDVASGMIAAAGEAMSRHGNDPNSVVILGAAFCIAVEKITTSIDPQFKRRLLIQLAEH